MAEPTEPQDTQESQAAKPSFIPKVLIAGFITVIVVAETLIFFFMVPSAEDVAALAEARLIDRVEASMTDDGEETLDNETETMEFPLGEYSVTFMPPGSDRNYNVEFRLSGVIYSKDEKAMDELYARKSARFQHRIMLEIRNATVDELMENQLGLIQRRILATSIEVLEEGEPEDKELPMLLGVPFTGFRVFEE